MRSVMAVTTAADGKKAGGRTAQSWGIPPQSTVHPRIFMRNDGVVSRNAGLETARGSAAVRGATGRRPPGSAGGDAGSGVHARRPGLPRGPAGVERPRRPVPGGRRAVHRGRRRGPGRRVRPGARPARHRQGWRAQRRRDGRLRRRPGRRLLPAHRRPRRPRRPPGVGRTRRQGRRPARGDPAVRPRGAGRDVAGHRRRRFDARRRRRLAPPEVRAGNRQPAVGRRGAGGRPVRHRQRRRVPGTVLGRPGRRRQLRRRHRLRVRPPSGRPGGRHRDGVLRPATTRPRSCGRTGRTPRAARTR